MVADPSGSGPIGSLGEEGREGGSLASGVVACCPMLEDRSYAREPSPRGTGAEGFSGHGSRGFCVDFPQDQQQLVCLENDLFGDEHQTFEPEKEMQGFYLEPLPHDDIPQVSTEIVSSILVTPLVQIWTLYKK